MTPFNNTKTAAECRPSQVFWNGKKVLITGHTGFKGGWLALWLHSLQASVFGLSLDPLTSPCLFTAADIASLLTSDFRADIRDEEKVNDIISSIQPDVIFHMAAQPLVRSSYEDPVNTFSTNTLGTVNILESVRKVKSVRVMVMITTDKVYDNLEWPYPYRETDILGGKDPYSTSKACAEMIISCYRRSFFSHNIPSISSARAGNVIGGGDWSKDRLIPDAICSFGMNRILHLRKPEAIRPWQHVLEALSGYLILAEAQWKQPDHYAEAWNFAPNTNGECTVEYISQKIARLWGEGAHVAISPSPDDPPEAFLLRLDSSKSRMFLGWRPLWTIDQTLEKTVAWYKAWKKGENMQLFSKQQIQEYSSCECL